jgi:WD40 repeat protein
VAVPPPGLKREAVSSRLRQTLVHPDINGILLGLTYSADGRCLFAGHARSGDVQVWDALTGKQLKNIETGPRGNSFGEYFQLSPDGRFLYVDKSTTQLRTFMGKEKRMYHWDFSGGVRSWDTATGKPLHDFQPGAERGVMSMQLSPDGATLLTFEGLSGDYEVGKATTRFGILWDARTGRQRGTLPKNASVHAAFSPDAKTLFTHAVNDTSEATALLCLDAATGETRRSFAHEQKHQKPAALTASPDGKLLVCEMRDAAKLEFCVQCCDVATGREIASFQDENKKSFGPPVFSPDGRILAACNSFLDRKLHLFDMVNRKPLQVVPVEGSRIWRIPAFSPDGKWIAAISQATPLNQSAFQLKAEDTPQPHILLIESATGEVRETLVAPPGIAVSLCFSPDGKTLASGGEGRVLLWDMTKAPGSK